MLPTFRELERELSGLHQKARDFSDADVLDQEVIELHRRALGSEVEASPPDLAALFDEAKVVFPDLVARRYAEVAQFHARLVENRREHLESEITAAGRRIEARSTVGEALEVRRREITNALRVSGPAEELLALRDELSRRDAEVRNLEGRLVEARSLDERAANLHREMEDAARALRADRRERAAIVDLASRTVENEMFWSDIASERSTYFVGISRARKHLLLTHCGQRARPPDFPRPRWNVVRTSQLEFLEYASAAE